MANRTAPPRNYPPEKARGGRIVLKRRWQKLVFIAGLAGAIGLVLMAISLSLVQPT